MVFISMMVNLSIDLQVREGLVQERRNAVIEHEERYFQYCVYGVVKYHPPPEDVFGTWSFLFQVFRTSPISKKKF